jgi:hypothetical protein
MKFGWQTVGPHAVLPVGTHWLFTQVLPFGQQALLQNEAAVSQHTVPPWQVWPIPHTVVPHKTWPGTRHCPAWQVLVPGQQAPPQKVAPASQQRSPPAHCWGALQIWPLPHMLLPVGAQN